MRDKLKVYRFTQQEMPMRDSNVVVVDNYEELCVSEYDPNGVISDCINVKREELQIRGIRLPWMKDTKFIAFKDEEVLKFLDYSLIEYKSDMNNLKIKLEKTEFWKKQREDRIDEIAEYNVWKRLKFLLTGRLS